jgi:hypothetical protein
MTIRRPFLLLLSVTLFYLTGCQKDELTDNGTGPEMKQSIKPAIKSRTGWSYKYTSGKMDSAGYKSSLYEYDRSGNNTFSASYNSAGITTSKTTNQYNENGKNSERIQYANGIMQIKWAYKYYNNGNLSHAVVDNYVNEITKLITNYNEKGQITDNTLYSSSGTVISTSSYKFDSEGNVIEGIIYDSNGKIQYKDNVQFNENNKPIQAIHIMPSGSANKETWTYDKNGYMTEWDVFDESNTLISKSTYSYNGKNITEELHMDGKGNLTFKSNSKYDSNGNQTEMVQYGADGNIVYKSTSKYDEFSNIVEQTSFTNSNQPDILEKYIYEYY